MYQSVWKRLFDILFSIGILAALSPLLLPAALAIKLDTAGPLFFLQSRLGRHGRTFQILKFRTMLHQPRTVSREIMPGDVEVTWVGRVLRRFKIDELPQLLNVLRGDMSLIGPRPCMPQHEMDFNDDGRARLRVRPGLTGLAQIRGNTHLTWPERWIYDRQYVERLSFVLDLKILLSTVAIVLLGEDKFIRKPHD